LNKTTLNYRQDVGHW